MESLFIEPGSLPGGRGWREACASVTAAHLATNVTKSASDSLSPSAVEALRCEVSPFAGLFQVFLLLCVYGGVLYKASELIANGSELLLLVPSLRGIVGSVVLPILGAVPDGAIVLFSGLGPNAQETLQVGVGALAGSTSMLLTVPWFLSVLAGRVNILNGVPTYYQKPKLVPPGNWSLDSTGVQPLAMVRISGRVMLLTASSLLIIQASAFATGSFFTAEQTAAVTRAAARSEKLPAIFCFFVCVGFFVWYLYDQVSATEDEVEYRETVVDELKQKAIRNGDVSLSAAFKEIWDAAVDADESTGLIVEEQKKKRLASLLHVFFHAYDYDDNNTIDKFELQNLMRDLGERVSHDEITKLYKKMDADGDGKICLAEFVCAMPAFIVARASERDDSALKPSPAAVQQDMEHGLETMHLSEDEEEEEELEEVPHDLRDKDPDAQIRNVMHRSFSMMIFGTALVLIFSDAMVNVMSDFGERIGVAPFYISFVLAPLASNASELIAAYSYAQKKTRKTVTISFSTLLGAAIMNNTFVLSIFMFLIAMKGLAWQFTAETISIIVVEIFMGWMSQKKVMTLRHGIQALLMFPAAMAIVAVLENVVGLD